jgi:endonuclease YncB( thermonuclease family)
MVLGRHVAKLAALAVVLMPAAALACPPLRDGPHGRVTAVPDGDTVLFDTGMQVRLVGMQAPKLPLGRPGYEAWPKAEEARQALEALVLDKNVTVRHGGAERDRHGRVLGLLFLDDDPDVPVQQQMLAAGWARVYSFPDNRACMADLLQAESRARAMRLGIWADPYYAVRHADKPAALLALKGRYELVEGRILVADEAGGRIYLNFGRSFHDDFTAVLDRAAVGLFAKQGLDPLQLGGALVRIRGWMDVSGGPRIEVTHPEQIEVLATK